jgi:uncharacterized damage-inducible protein DinB
MVNWFERKFDFSTDQNIIPSLIERLDGTPVRLRYKLALIDQGIYASSFEGKWSILEHIGHLGDLEPLWIGRLEDILNGEKEMRVTDLSNAATDKANHNTRSADELIDRFERMRKVTVDKLQALTEEEAFKFSLHPRLKTPMRTIDLFTFVAEHDDHHLAKITALAQAVH